MIELGDGSRVRLPPSSLAQIMASQTYGVRPPDGGPAGAAGTSSGWFGGALRVLRGSVEVFASKVLRAKPLEVVTPTAARIPRSSRAARGWTRPAGLPAPR